MIPMARMVLMKAVVFVHVIQVNILICMGFSFVFNYSLLVKRTSQPDGYRPDCKCCCEKLYVAVSEVTLVLPLAFHIILWTAL